MKHKLLSLIALAGAMFMSASAFAFDKPVKPQAPQYEGTWVTPEVDGTYYIYNVGAGQFLGCGQDWGTRAITTSTQIVKLGGSTFATSANKNAILPFKMLTPETEADAEGTWYWIQRQNVSGGQGPWLVHEGNAGWSDGNDSRRDSDKNALWRIEPLEDGISFKLRPHDMVVLVDAEGTPILDNDLQEQYVLTDKLFGIDSNNMNGTYCFTWTDLAETEANYTAWRFVSTEEADSIDAFIKNEAIQNEYKAALTLYEAKFALYETLVAAEEAGANYTTAEAVYNNPDATAAQLEAAGTQLKLMIKLAGQEATTENPIEITEVLKNPDFSAGNIGGWETNYESGKQAQNIGYQGATYTNGDITINKFIEAWLPAPGTIGDGYLQQTIFGLPAGKYRLECDAIAVLQSNASAEVTGAYLFIQSGVLESRTALNTGNEKPEHFSVDFDNDGQESLTFGLKTVSASNNWMAADNFRIYYCGVLTESPHYKQLQNVIKDAEENYGSLDDIYCEATAKDSLTMALTAAKAITTDDTDATCDEAVEKINNAITALKASVEAYKVLLVYLPVSYGGEDKLSYYYKIAENCGMEDLAEQFETWSDDWCEAYEEGTFTAAQITELTSSIMPALKAGINPQTIKEGTDLTWLMTNPGFDTNLDGWEVKSGATPTISSGLAEVYQQKFDIHQVIEDMPAGVYEIALQGFTRNQPGGNRKAFTVEDQQGTTFAIYTPTNDEKIQSILAGASEELIAQRGEETEPEDYIMVDNGDYDIAADIDGTVYYMPNGMASARKHFDAGHYKTTIRVVNSEVGDLDLGIRCESTQEWCLWDALTITYVGEDINAYRNLILKKIEELDATHEMTDGIGEPIYITEEGETLYINTKAEANDVAANIGGDNASEQLKNIMDKLTAAMKYLTDGQDLAEAVKDQLAEYWDLGSGRVSDFTDNVGFVDYVEQQQALLAESGTIKSNDDLKAMPEEISTKWTGLIMDFVQENPYDADAKSNFGNATEAIYNARYTSYTDATAYTTKGWTFEKPDSVAASLFSTGTALAEVYNVTNFDVYQTIKGLTPGYYILSVDAFQRPCFPADITDSLAQVNNITLYARTSLDEFKTPIKNITVNAQEASVGAGGESEITLNGAKAWIANDKTSAAAYLDLVDLEDLTETALPDMLVRPNSLYRNDLTLGVDEDGVMTIGLRNSGRHLNGDWTIFGNWMLTYIGTEIPDGVKNIKNEMANGVVNIFTLDGRQASRMQRGVNIVRSNGKVQKVLVK